MIIPGPVLVLGIPVITAVVLQLFHRWTIVSAWLAAISAALVGGAVTFLPATEAVDFGAFEIALSRPLIILGRVLVIEAVDRLPLAFLFFTSAGLFIIAWRLLPHSNFFHMGTAMVTLLSGALLMQQVVYAALLVEMAAILAVFPLHEPGIMGGQGHKSGGHTVGGLRYMTYATLALPGLMITQLLLDQFAITPNDLGLLNTATVLLTLSFAILLGAVPFQSWLSTVATDGSPPVVTFLFTVNIGTVWFMLLAYLQSYAWLAKQAMFGPLFSAVGFLMMVIGGVLAASQKRLGRLVGYATLVDNGAMLVALGTRQAGGLALAVMMLIARPLSLGLMTLGLEGLRRIGAGNDSMSVLEGAGWVAPWRAVAFMMGGVALAGFPLSLGFTARWGLYRLVAGQSFFRAIVALVSSAGVMMGLISASRALLLRDLNGNKPRSVVSEDGVVVVLILLLIGATLMLGIFPQTPSQVALQMAEGFTFFNNP